MMDFILFDDAKSNRFRPFTLTRPVSELLCGITSIREKWEYALKARAGYSTAPWLSAYFTGSQNAEKIMLRINGRYLPSDDLVRAIATLREGFLLVNGSEIVASRTNQLFEGEQIQTNGISTEAIEWPWDLFARNDAFIRSDFLRLTAGRKSEALPAGNRISGADYFLEEGARVEMSIINTRTGPVYFGNHSEVMEGCMIRGPFAMGDHALLKMGAKVYGATSLGPECRVGGEVSNSVMLGYSNKGHDGFLGNSVIGCWCNLGADTNNSNLKNNYGPVRVYSMQDKAMIETGLTFCGLFMGDHSKAGINTMFNTGTVTGVCANIFDGGFPPKFVPSFSWGGREDAPRFTIDKALETAQAMYQRRGRTFSDAEAEILRYLSIHGM